MPTPAAAFIELLSSAVHSKSQRYRAENRSEYNGSRRAENRFEVYAACVALLKIRIK